METDELEMIIGQRSPDAVNDIYVALEGVEDHGVDEAYKNILEIIVRDILKR